MSSAKAWSPERCDLRADRRHARYRRLGATGAIESGVIGVPQNLLAKKQGLRELADLSESGSRYAFAAFVAKRSFLAENHERMVRFIEDVGRVDSLSQDPAQRRHGNL